MYAKVVPAVRLPKSFGEYDYAVPEEFRAFVKRGSWVVVPWRNKPTDALVVDVNDKPAIDPSKIKSMLGFGDMNPVDEDLIAVLGRAAEHWFSSPTSIVKAFLPVTPKTKMLKEDLEPAGQAGNSSSEAVHTKTLLNYRSPREKITQIVEQTKRSVQNGSVVVVTPHSDEVRPIFEALQAAVSNYPVIELHGGLTGPALRRAWANILEAPRCVVVGTRLASFAPAHSPALFLVAEADSADLQQYDQNPRYDARDICSWRAEAAQAELIMASQAPRLEEFVAGFTITDSTNTGEAILVDIAGNPKGADNPLSPVVMARSEEALRSGKKVLLYHNRLGAAGALFCRDCSRVFRCPACKIAATVLERTIRCGRCGLEAPLPAVCPDCNSANLGRVGLGTEAMVPALQQLFPDRSVSAYDSATSAEQRQKILTDSEVIIGTKLLLHDVSELGPSDCWGCVVATSLDEALSHPGFRVTEDAWRTVQVLRNIAGASGTELMLQTIDPDNPKIRRLLHDFTGFMRTESEDRQLVGYPPAGDLITVTIKANTEPEAERAAAEFRHQAEQLIAGASFAGPLRHSRPYRDGKWRRVVAIKAKQVPQELTKLLRSLPEEYIIDRNPETVG